MNINYKTNKLRRQLGSPLEIKKHFGVNAKRVSQRIDDIIASNNLQVLCSIPGARCHPLTGDREGEWAIDVSANHRLIFTLDHDPVPVKEDGSIDRIMVTNIEIIAAQEDYH